MSCARKAGEGRVDRCRQLSGWLGAIERARLARLRLQIRAPAHGLLCGRGAAAGGPKAESLPISILTLTCPGTRHRGLGHVLRRKGCAVCSPVTCRQALIKP